MDFEAASSYFTQSWAYGNEYRPLLPFSYALDAIFSGESPVGYHVSNTLIHLANAFLIGGIALQLGLPSSVAALSILIFLVNPVSHEAFLWISGRPVALSTLFVLISVWTFIKSAGRSLAWSAASVIFFVSGLLVYEGAVVLPLLLLLIGFSKTGFSSPKLVVRPVLVHLVIMAGYILSWNIFFEWKITKLSVESSLTGSAPGV